MSLVKMVFADMDGTFVATDKSVPPQNMELLDVLASRDIGFVPCTGRPVSAVPQQILDHEATRYAVGSNGSVVYDNRAKAPIHVVGMNKKAVLDLYEAVKCLNVTFDVFADGEVYAERTRYDAMGSYGIDGPTLSMLRRVRKPVDKNVAELVERARAVEKITCFWSRECDRRGLELAIDRIGGFSSAHGHPKNFELQAEGVSKGFALVWLCKHTGVNPADVVAFGDEANDVSLLAAAGDGVAMANAIPQARAVANHTAPSNDDAGVASYVMALLGVADHK